MATLQSSVEHQTLISCTPKLTLAFKSALSSIGTELLAKGLISEEVLEKVHTVGIVDSMKATEMVTCVTTNIRVCPSKFDDFMALDVFQEPCLKSVHELLTTEYERLKKSAASQKEALTDLTSTQAVTVVDKTRETKMKRIILNKIKSEFASLQVEVRKALEAQLVEMKTVHQFLTSFFQDDCSHIPEPSDLINLFNIITEKKLWSYDNYSPLEELVEKLVPDNESVATSVTDYVNEYSGFCATVNIIEFKDILKEEDSEDGQEHFSPKKYTPEHYRKLRVKLKLDKKPTEITLAYVNTLWKALAKKFDIPSLTTLIDKIVEGSIIIHWYILSSYAEKIRAHLNFALRFFQRHNIVEIDIDYDTLYSEDWMNGSTALHQASFAGETEEVEKLLAEGVDINQQDDNGRTGLILAAWQGHADIVIILVKHGAVVNLTDKYGETALIKAAEKGHTSTVKRLVDLGAAVDIQNKYGVTALMEASARGHTEVVKVLVEAKADLNITDQNGETALMKASENGDTEVVKVLVEAKADLNITDQDGETALIWASYRGHTEVVKVLAEAKADLNITDQDGDTALIDAVSKGHTSTVNILLDRGAATDIRNKEGLTALDIARVKNLSDICEILEHYTREDSTSKLTEEQKAEHKQSIGQRFLKMAERIFLREQVKKKEQLQQQQKEGLNRESSNRPVDGGMKKRSLWSRFRGQRNRPTQTVGTAPAVP